MMPEPSKYNIFGKEWTRKSTPQKEKLKNLAVDREKKKILSRDL